MFKFKRRGVGNERLDVENRHTGNGGVGIYMRQVGRKLGLFATNFMGKPPTSHVDTGEDKL